MEPSSGEASETGGTVPYTGPALLHIGYIKTGSTSLQKEVFMNPDLGFSLPGRDFRHSREMLIEWFFTSDGYLFDPEAVAAEMDRAEAPLRAKGLIPVWTDETLSGNPLRRHYIGPQVLDRVSRLPKQMKVVMSVREQRSFTMSAYREYLKRESASMREFVGTGNEPLSYYPTMRENFLAYDIAVSRWQAVLGRENVLVLPFEMLRKDKHGYFQRLIAFSGVRPFKTPDLVQHNTGQGGTALVVRRFVNRFIGRSGLHHGISRSSKLALSMVRMVNRLAPKSLNARIEAKWKAMIKDRYDHGFANSNARLSKLIDIDLKALGYTCADVDNGDLY